MGDSRFETVCLVCTSQGITPLAENKRGTVMKKPKYRLKSIESLGNSNDTSANLYMSMLTSPAYFKLSNGAVRLYNYCKAQLYAEKRKPVPQIRQLNETQLSYCFTMNKSKWLNLYHIYNSDNGQFYKDMEQLIELGFVELVESGKTNRSKNIYMLSDKWKEIR